MSGTILLILRAALTLVLYVFLTWVLITLWRDLRSQRKLLASQKSPQINLEIQFDDNIQTEHFFGTEVTIGRDATCTCILDSQTVSARHARLTYHHGQWWAEDLGSTNGTFLDQEPITTPTVITTGDQLRCGDIRIKVQTATCTFFNEDKE
jgi:pSer/pThr/pTyr-binding forkhead associated (FHA) protein